MHAVAGWPSEAVFCTLLPCPAPLRLTQVVLDVAHPEVALLALHLAAQRAQRLAQQVHQQAQAASVRGSNLNLQGQSSSSSSSSSRSLSLMKARWLGCNLRKLGCHNQ
jgi:hypothetical protein